jgi:protein dpy-30
MQAMAAVARERPDDPIEFIAHYLLSHNPRRQQEPTTRKF